MKLMAIDLEMNQPSGKIIQVGAVTFDPKSGEIFETIRTYVNPKEQLSDEIIKLTGITQDQVDNAPSVADTYHQLKAWAQQQKVFRNPVVWGAGESNDSIELWKQAAADPENFMGHRVIDVKTICQTRSIVMGGDVAGGLQSYLSRVGVPWNDKFGKPHDALADAFNTAGAFLVYSQFLEGHSYIERFHVQLGKPKNKGKWQGVISKMDEDVANLVINANEIVLLRERLKQDV
jgi:inhibitor of KinA sporulation pathway (predicted exonuclease)